MAYTPCYPNKINWQNEPSEATALNNVNLNKMDSAIYTIDGRVVDMSTRIDTDDTAITNLQGNVSDLQSDMTTAQGNITALQNGKVDKVNGKGLSQVDNVTVTQHVAYGTVVSTIKTYKQDGTEVTSQVCNGIVVDSALSNSSTNPVQNKAVKSAIDGKSTVAISDTLATGTTLANITIDGTTTAIKGSDIEVDEELSPTSTNPVENKAIYDALNNLLPSKTVSGNPISISDASGFNAKALTVSMNPIQDLHGYSNPWPGGAGKNKFSCVDHLNPSANLSATKNADGSVRIYGTPTSTWASVSDLTDCALPAGQYTFSIQSAIAYNIYTNCYVGGTNTNRTITAGNTSITFTVNGTIDNIRLMISGMTVNTPVDVTIKPMLASGTDTVFEPYSNICPISGRTEASVNQGSVDITTLYNGQIQSNGSFSWNNNRISNVNSSQMNTYFLKKGTHTLTFNKLNQSAPDLVECTVMTKNDNFEIVDNFATAWHSLPYTFELTADAYVYFTARKDYGTALNTADYKTLIIEETHTKEFGQTVYGGILDFVNGELIVDIPSTAKVKLSDLNWTYQSAQSRFYTADLASLIKKPSTSSDIPSGMMCECYKIDSFSNLSNGKIAVETSGNLFAKDENYTDVTTWLNAVGDYYIDYPLATPTTIQLSPEALTLLKGLNVISTDGDDMELKYSVSLDSLLPTE